MRTSGFPHNLSRRLWRRLAGSSAMALLALSLAGNAALAQSLQSYDINAQPLRSGLNQLARASGLNLAVPAGRTAGLSGNAVQGAMTPEQALAELLRGTGLQLAIIEGTVVLAAGPRAAALPDDYIGTIGVSGGVDAAALPYHTPGGSSHISGQQVVQNRGTSTGDFLSGQPGVINADNRNGAGIDVNVRGMQGMGRVPVVIDGAQQETAVWRGYAGVIGRSYVDPDLVSEVTINRGPSTAVDTPGANGGAVRMQTLRVDDILMPGRNWGFRFRAGVNGNSSSRPTLGTVGGLYGAGTYDDANLPGSYGGSDGMDRPSLLEPTGGAASLAFGYRSEVFDLVLAHSRRQNGNYHAGTNGEVPGPVFSPATQLVPDGNGGWMEQEIPGRTIVTFDGLNRFRAGEEVLNTSQDNVSSLGRLTWRIAPDHTLEFGHMRYESEYGDMMPSQIIRGQGAYEADLSAVDMASTTLRYRWNPEHDNLIDLTLNLWHTETEARVPYQFYMTPDSYYPELANTYGNTNQRFGFNIENTARFDTRFGSVSLTGGLGYLWEDQTPAPGSNLNAVRDGNRQEVNAFLSAHWEPSERLSVDASLGWSRFRSVDRGPRRFTHTFGDVWLVDGEERLLTSEESGAIWNNPPPGWSFLRVDQVQYDNRAPHRGSGVSPSLALTYEAWDGIQLYGRFAQATRMPSFFEATMGASQNSIPYGFSLRPERARTLELGVNVDRASVFAEGDQLFANLNLFNTEVSDYLTRLNDSHASIGNIRSANWQGMELAASYQRGNFSGSLAWTHYFNSEFCAYEGQNSNSGITLPLCLPGGAPNSYVVGHLPPRDSVSLTLGTTAFDERLSLGARVTYVGERPVTGLGVEGGSIEALGGTLQLVEWRPYTTLDLFGSYEINTATSLDFAIDNVTDTYYMDTLTMGLMASPGRTARMSLTHRF